MFPTLRSRSIAFVTPLALAAFVLLGACGSDDGAPAIAPSSEAGVDAGGPDADGGVGEGGRPAPYGLDMRPPNKTCLPPARPPARAAVKLEQEFAATPIFPSTMLAQIPGDKSRIFLAAIHGQIFAFSKDNPPAVAPPAVLTLPPPVTPTGQLTLLGFAFHPKFAQNGRIFLSFTTDSVGPPGVRSVIARMRSTDNGASFGEYTELIDFPQTGTHNGGGIAFGNDGSLFLSFGDGGDGNDTFANGQKKTGFFSKILRIDVDASPAPGLAYAIPDGNPFKSGGGEPATYSYGFRNPFRISIDRASGDLWVGDVGEGTWEEIDRITAPGGNYGWPCREGAHDYLLTPDVCPGGTQGLVNPTFEYVSTGAASVTGGVVYRGSAIPSLAGTYVFGDYVTGEIRGLDFDPSTGAPRSALLDPTAPTGSWVSFSEDDDGEVYAIDLGARIFKIVPAGPDPASAFPKRLSETGCFDPSNARAPRPALVPFDVNARSWSDGAEKQQWLALPDGAAIKVAADGDFELPTGAVVFQTLSLESKPVETRMMVRHVDGEWAGYSFEWNAAGSDALLLPANKSTTRWSFPGRGECVSCHTKAAGRTLGLETSQLNGDFVYPSTGRRSNQLATFDHIGMFDAPLGRLPKDLPALPSPSRPGPDEPRARAYLHAACSFCHRSDAPATGAAFDLRFSTTFAATKTCDVSPLEGTLEISGARLIAPGAPAKSVLLQRMRSKTSTRMPPLGTRTVDTDGAALVERWLGAVKACP